MKSVITPLRNLNALPDYNRHCKPDGSGFDYYGFYGHQQKGSKKCIALQERWSCDHFDTSSHKASGNQFCCIVLELSAPKPGLTFFVSGI
ncbi:MAG: hypothetical protein ACM31E_11135 [Fibrobacterota bacterium]